MTSREVSFSVRFSAWLGEDPEHQATLERRGLQPGLIQRIANGTCHESILLTQAPVLAEVSGVSVHDCYVAQARIELWGGEDHVPDVHSYSALVVALGGMVEKRGTRAVMQRLGVKDGDTVRRWRRGARHPAFAMVRKLLELIDEHQRDAWVEQPVVPIVASVPASAVAPPPSTDPSADRRKAAVAALSMFHGAVDLMRAVVPLGEFLDGDRERVLRTVRELFEHMGIDRSMLERLRRPSGESGAGDMQVIKEVLAAFGPHRGSGGRRRT